jgi:hypothetical protein
MVSLFRKKKKKKKKNTRLQPDMPLLFERLFQNHEPRRRYADSKRWMKKWHVLSTMMACPSSLKILLGAFDEFWFEHRFQTIVRNAYKVSYCDLFIFHTTFIPTSLTKTLPIGTHVFLLRLRFLKIGGRRKKIYVAFVRPSLREALRTAPVSGPEKSEQPPLCVSLSAACRPRPKS